MPESEVNPETPSERPILSVTVDELSQVPPEHPIDSNRSFDCWVLADAYRIAAEAAAKAGRSSETLVYSLFQGLCQVHFKPDDSGEPFGAMSVGADGRRTLIPADIPAGLNVALAGLAPHFRHPVLRARIADLTWINNRKLGGSAQVAIASYCECVGLLRREQLGHSHEAGDRTDFDAMAYLRRAAQIAVATKGKQPFPEPLVSEIRIRKGGRVFSQLSAWVYGICKTGPRL